MTRKPTQPSLSAEARQNFVRQQSISRLMVVSYRRLESVVMHELLVRGFEDIRPTHLAVLTHVPLTGIRTNEIAVLANMTKQAVGQIATQLEGLGYLTRRIDPTDARARILDFTDKGRRLWEASYDILAAADHRLVDVLGADGLAMLRSSLRSIADTDAL